MKSDVEELGQLIVGMRDAYSRGENVMAWARENSTLSGNSLVSTLIAYDLQAGSYVEYALKNPGFNNRWCAQVSGLLGPLLEHGDSIMEVGVGEATTLAGVVNTLKIKEINATGFDVSWSRLSVARKWTDEHVISPTLFVGDLFHIPMADNSIDVVYTSHSLEPNGGKEQFAIAELLRVARKAVVLIEPIYELASEAARQRMVEHGYVRNLRATAEYLGGGVIDYRLLEVCGNPLNPSGVIVVMKSDVPPEKLNLTLNRHWRCPMTGATLADHGDIYFAEEMGIGYPVIRGIPMLRAEHAMVASKLFA